MDAWVLKIIPATKSCNYRPFLNDSFFRECGDAFHLVLWRSKTPATARLSFITKSTLFKTILDAIDMHSWRVFWKVLLSTLKELCHEIQLN